MQNALGVMAFGQETLKVSLGQLDRMVGQWVLPAMMLICKKTFRV